MGYWIIENACRDAMGWKEPYELSVNVAVRQLQEPDFIQRVVEILEDTQCPWHRITFEITESVFVGEDTRVIETLNALTRCGAKISLDDFGTGYSSMNYLSRLPLDELKIDRYFIWNMEGSGNAAIVEKTIELAKEMKMTVVAEGIENEDQVRRLQLIGCEKLQGYYYSKPVAANQIEALVLVN